jgi:tRNA pseudouridine38-40 synthase
VQDQDGGLVRVRLDLAYDGTDFAGWAVQPGQRTVQGTLSEALSRVLRMPPETVALVVAGRTDAGVHARGQVCHLDAPLSAWLRLPGRSGLGPAAALVRRLRGVLPDDVRVGRAARAAPGFDARFSAVHRRYAYRISDAPGGASPLRRRDVLAHRPAREHGLDLAAMSAASSSLVGLHDFAAFCRRREGATTVRTLLEYSWSRATTTEGDELVVARVVADAFCHSMVRALVGGALAVGDGRRPASWLADVLSGRTRDPGVVVAPPHGLVLEEVAYPPDDELAARATQARAVRELP